MIFPVFTEFRKSAAVVAVSTVFGNVMISSCLVWNLGRRPHNEPVLCAKIETNTRKGQTKNGNYCDKRRCGKMSEVRFSSFAHQYCSGFGDHTNRISHVPGDNYWHYPLFHQREPFALGLNVIFSPHP